METTQLTPEPNHSPVTNEVIYRELGEVHAKVDTLISAHAVTQTRVAKLESWKAWVVGLAFGASYMFNALFNRHA